MDAVSVSIGIPFLNAGPTLADAVRSVLAQTYGDWELLLVDDGSSDGSVEIARGVRDPRVRVVSDGVRRGLPDRLNQIAALARGRYLARMDADDLMHPERLERQVRFLDADPRVDLVDTATFTIDEHNEPLGVRGDRPLDCRPGAVLKWGLLLHPTVTGRTGWFRQNPYDPRFVRAEDHELWVRTCRKAVFGRLQEPLFFYRESLSGNLRNYLRTQQTARKILRVYGPAAVGHAATAVLVARSCLKSWTYRACTAMGRQGRLIRARTRPLTAAESAAARAALRTVLQTPLPTSPTVRRLLSGSLPPCGGG
jgi:glycosyltransferase involved in cell wall biosynthesis